MAGSKKSADPAATEKKERGEFADLPGDQRLEKVQELLFGPRSRELEAATAQLAMRVDQSVAALQKDAAEWRESLMTHLGNEVDELKKSIRKEQQARTQEFVHTALEERLEKLDAVSKKADDETNESLAATTAELRSEIDRARAELESATARVSRDLDHDKADRAALSGLFKHVADQLQGENGQ